MLVDYLPLFIFLMLAVIFAGFVIILSSLVGRKTRSREKLMTYECALRFFADHLSGDVYFRVHHEGHNLDRTRVQLALLDSMEAHQAEMSDIVARAAAEVSAGA